MFPAFVCADAFIENSPWRNLAEQVRQLEDEVKGPRFQGSLREIQPSLCPTVSKSKVFACRVRAYCTHGSDVLEEHRGSLLARRPQAADSADEVWASAVCCSMKPT